LKVVPGFVRRNKVKDVALPLGSQSLSLPYHPTVLPLPSPSSPSPYRTRLKKPSETPENPKKGQKRVWPKWPPLCFHPKPSEFSRGFDSRMMIPPHPWGSLGYPTTTLFTLHPKDRDPCTGVRLAPSEYLGRVQSVQRHVSLYPPAV